MGLRYYDEAVYNLINSWVVDPNMRVLRPSETQALFAINADMNEDQPMTLPFIAISRSNEIEILQTKKNLLSFRGKTLLANNEKSVQLNAVPIRLGYQIDIYSKFFDEADEYVREFTLALINNPVITINVPYQGLNIPLQANISLVPTISDNSDISERLFRDQFTRFTIQFNINDAYLYSVGVNRNITVSNPELEVVDTKPIEHIEVEKL